MGIRFYSILLVLRDVSISGVCVCKTTTKKQDGYNYAAETLVFNNPTYVFWLNGGCMEELEYEAC